MCQLFLLQGTARTKKAPTSCRLGNTKNQNNAWNSQSSNYYPNQLRFRLNEIYILWPNGKPTYWALLNRNTLLKKINQIMIHWWLLRGMVYNYLNLYYRAIRSLSAIRSVVVQIMFWRVYFCCSLANLVTLLCSTFVTQISRFEPGTTEFEAQKPTFASCIPSI